jgi:hypothetical protein
VNRSCSGLWTDRAIEGSDLSTIATPASHTTGADLMGPASCSLGRRSVRGARELESLQPPHSAGEPCKFGGIGAALLSIPRVYGA